MSTELQTGTPELHTPHSTVLTLYMDSNHGLTLIYRSYGSVGQTYIILYLSLHIFEDKIAILFKQTKWYNFIENISIIELKSNLLDLFTPYCFEQYVHMHKLLFTTIKNTQNEKKSLLICTDLCWSITYKSTCRESVDL